MTRLVLIAASLITLGVTTFAYAEPDEKGAEIRRQYRGQETPDHIAFNGIIYALKKEDDADHDIMLEIVHRHMRLPSQKEAAEFLAKVQTAADDLTWETTKLERDLLCSPDSARDPGGIYKSFDELDDLREVTFHNAYTKFMSSLNDQEEESFTRWFDEMKSGVSYYVRAHASTWATSSRDVVSHVELWCADLRRATLSTAT
jgi:hypothetical protein